MPLTEKVKKEHYRKYQREYMQRLRAKAKAKSTDEATIHTEEIDNEDYRATGGVVVVPELSHVCDFSWRHS